MPTRVIPVGSETSATSPATARADRPPPAVAPRGGGAPRHVGFFAWAAFLALLVNGTCLVITVLALGSWLTGRNTATTPFTDLAFFALGVVIIGTGLLAQLRHPERQIAGIQQAVVGVLALGSTGLLGRRIEPFVGAVVLLLAIIVLLALHPARRACGVIGGARPSPPLLALALFAALPCTAYAALMLAQGRRAGPACFLEGCAYGDRFAELAALAIAIAVLGLLTATRPRGWRVTARSVGAAAIIPGAASVVFPTVPGAPGRFAGVVAVAWGILVIVVTSWEARRVARQTDVPPMPDGGPGGASGKTARRRR